MDQIFDVVDIRSGDFYFALHEEVIRNWGSTWQ